MRTILEPLNTYGAMTVYRRKPRPIGALAFVVLSDKTNLILKEFDELAKAQQWAKQNKTP